MDVKTTFFVGIALVVFSICGYSQNVPDDVVYTEVKKTLVNGTTGILRCAFRGEPNAVFWKKGTDPAKSPSVILLSYGDLFGPRYEDGSCDIDDNYSLVFKEVTESDAGRYICRVSNYKGILIYNFTDVTIINTPVKTKDSVSVQKGAICVIPCQIDIRHRKVSWVKGSNDTLITVETSHHAFKRSGHLGGFFDITKDNSLVVNNVKILHDGSYTCQVTDYDTGHVFQNTTRLHVFAYPLEPFPSIKECPEGQQHISSCTLRIEAETILTCEVKKYYPDIDLYFRHGTTRIDSLETTVWNNTDGTRNKVITIATNGTIQTIFECVASGMVGEAEDRTVTVHLIRDGQQNLVIITIVVPIILLLVVTSVVITVYVVKRRNKRKYDKVPTMVMVYNPQRHDLISYIELWKLVEFGTKKGIKDAKFEEALKSLMQEISLSTSGSRTCSKTPTDTNGNYYDRFCDWKANYVGNSQKEACLEACSKAGLNSVVGKLRDYSESTRAITLEDLEHTLWHSTANTENIIALLQGLGVVHKPLEERKDKEKGVIKNVMTLLMQWRDTNNHGNQEVMLSLALEAINYTPSNLDFFRIPDCKKSELDENEIKELLIPDLTSRHCSILIDVMENYDKTSWYRLAIKYFGSSQITVWIENVIDQNRTYLFDSHQMLKDWWSEQKCSNYDKRLKLQRAAEKGENFNMIVIMIIFTIFIYK
ncbi:uncharacterized protein LOC135155088 [Lytechinus pictus]|uniref:uncharacterized protein LOC135155088 n=1 Tax=Lytechinus pictus TaxID=7653 RepID=UPI0030B9B27E